DGDGARRRRGAARGLLFLEVGRLGGCEIQRCVVRRPGSRRGGRASPVAVAAVVVKAGVTVSRAFELRIVGVRRPRVILDPVREKIRPSLRVVGPQAATSSRASPPAEAAAAGASPPAESAPAAAAEAAAAHAAAAEAAAA